MIGTALAVRPPLHPRRRRRARRCLSSRACMPRRAMQALLLACTKRWLVAGLIPFRTHLRRQVTMAAHPRARLKFSSACSASRGSARHPRLLGMRLRSTSTVHVAAIPCIRSHSRCWLCTTTRAATARWHSRCHVSFSAERDCWILGNFVGFIVQVSSASRPCWLLLTLPPSMC